MFKRIIQWNKDRNIPKVFDSGSEINMMDEELWEELYEADNDAERVDALCDLIVIATGALWKLGYDPDKAMAETLKEIESRGGAFDTTTGKWMKEITGKEYQADYDSCKEDD